ncbi:hypothetical protein [Streptomyces capoamus]|uniref:hypothetical protein n=1 Tax=Streptomyces capoamus TaxID=68183 RepID=UPI003399337F
MSAFARRAVGSKCGWRSLAVGILVSVSACSTIPDRAVGEKQLRRLGESGQAVQARKRAEQRLRAVARAYDDRTPLSLGLVVVHDVCVPGSGPGWFFQQKTDNYEVVCSMNITAYYGADPRHMADTLDGLLTAGDHDRPGAAGSARSFPFPHDDYGRRLVAYYRGHGPNPPGLPCPGTGHDGRLRTDADLGHDSRRCPAPTGRGALRRPGRRSAGVPRGP